MKHLFFILFVFILNRSQAQWDWYNLPDDFPINNVLNTIAYSSPGTVWARYSIYNSPTYLSKNGGESFYQVNTMNNNGFLPVSDTLLFGLDYNGKLLKSNDGAISFEEIQIVNENRDTGFVNSQIIDFYFYNDSMGWVLGDDTTSGCKEIWTTENGGSSWSRLPCDSIQLSNTAFQFVYTNTKSKAQGRVFIRDGRSKYIYNKFLVVDHLGKYWRESDTLPSMRYVSNAFVFMDSLIGFSAVADMDTTLAITKDGGKSWKLSTALPIGVNKICYARSTPNQRGFLIAAGAKGAYISYDTAQSWLYLDDIYHSNIAFYDSETGISMTQPTSNRNGYINVFTGGLPWPTGMSEMHRSKGVSLLVYPNPASKQIRIDVEKESSVKQIIVTNIEGKVMLEQSIYEDMPFYHNISLDAYPQGMYFIKLVVNNTEELRGKFIVEK